MYDRMKTIRKWLFVAIIVILILLFASQKQASALVYKGLDAGIISAPGNTRTGNLNSGTSVGQEVIDFDYSSRPISTTYDLIGFRIHSFIIQPNSINTSHTESLSCSGTYQEPTTSGGTTIAGSYQWNCSGTNTNQQNILPSDYFINLYAFVYYTDNTSQFCYMSSEVQDTFLCPTMNSSSPVQKIQVYIKYSRIQNWLYTIQTSNNLAFYNYESTEIINSNGVIVNQQQQTNSILSGTDTTGATTNSTSLFSSAQSELNTGLNNTTGEANLVTIVQTFFTQIDNSTCQPINLPIPFTNEMLVLPCIGTELQTRVPLLWTLYTTIITGVLVFRFWNFAIDMIKHLVDPYSTGLSGVSDISGGGK